LITVLLTGSLYACSSPAPKVAPPKADSTPPDKKVVQTIDDKHEAYTNFTLASIAMSGGHNEKAKTYLSKAIAQDPESLYLTRKMALLLERTKEYQEARVFALKCIDLDPENPENHILLAEIYGLMKDDNLAIEEYEKIVGLDPENQRIRLLLTTILIRKNRFQEALHHLRKLTEQSPQLIIAHYYRGRIYLEMKRFREAEDAFLEALRFNKKLEPALFDLGTLYQMTNRSVDAIETYEKLVELYPGNMAVRERLVSLLFEIGLKKKAEMQIEKIKEYSKPGESARQALGLIYLRQGKLSESIKELSLIVSAWPDDTKSRFYLATALEEKGDIEKALEQFRMIAPESKYFVSSQIHIAYMLENREDYEGAVSTIQKAISIKKEKIELYLMLASLYETMEQYEKGISVVKEGLEQDDKNVALIFRLGVLLDKSGDKESCMKEMKKILEINPNHAETANYIGYTYAEQGIRLDEAMNLIQKAAKLKPGSGYIIDSLGWVYFQKGLYDEAVHHLERAIELTPDDPTINEHLGDAYRKKKEYKKALQMYEKALTLNHPNEAALREKITEVKQTLEQDN